MLTVRFPTGEFVTYNNATYLHRDDERWSLYTKDMDKGGQWIASIQLSAGCVVESTPPCKIGNVNRSGILEAVISNLRGFSEWQDRAKLADLKRALKSFNAKTRRWNGNR